MRRAESLLRPSGPVSSRLYPWVHIGGDRRQRNWRSGLSAPLGSKLVAVAIVASELLCCDVDGNNIGPKGCLSLAQKRWDGLQVLSLSNPLANKGSNHFGDQGCRHIAALQMHRLTHFFLRRPPFKAEKNQIGGRGGRHLSKAHWPALR
jgi:hypothetical protein